MKIVIVIPTYNEKDNLPILLEKIAALQLPDWQAIVVDDNSPDGTGQLAEALKSRYPLGVIHRPRKQGLGSAYRQALTEALDRQPDYVVQMDADLSHDPADIPMLLALARDYDLVIGSRYIPGGATKNWSGFRRRISRSANFLVRLILSSKIHDLTSGFKVFRDEVLDKLNLDQTSSRGYNFQIEVSVMVERLGYRIKEMPIIFTERRSGHSKFSLRIVLECAWRVFLLAFRHVPKKQNSNRPADSASGRSTSL